MFRHPLKICLVAALAAAALHAVPVRAGAPEEFAMANRLYDEKKFEDARQVYQGIVSTENYSANLFYNLGNTAVRLGDPGQAVLNYERALALDPSHPEARANLDFVRGQAGAKVAARPWTDRLFLQADADTYAVTAAIMAWLAIGSLVLILLRDRRANSLLWLGGVGALAICAYACAAILHLEKERSLAVVITKRAEARFAPADNATLAETLPTGSRVRILNERGPWVYCELPNQARAWLATKTVERVRVGT